MTEFNDYLNEWFYAPDQKNKSIEQLAKELFSKSAFWFPDKQGKTLLHYIAADFFNYKDEFRLALIKVLFDQKANANAIDNHGRTALHDLLETWQDIPFSFAKKFDAIAELFFQQGAQFTLRDKNEKTPLDVLLEKPNYSVFAIKVLIKFILLKQPHLTAPSTVTRHEKTMAYWNIYQNNIRVLLEQRIADSDYTLYDICSSNHPTQLAKPLYPYHEPLKEFTSEAFKNKFYEYSDRLQSNLDWLQQAIVKKINTNTIINKTNLLLRKNLIPINEDIVREIFNYLSYSDIRTTHKAVHPAFFKEVTAITSNKPINVKDKPTLSCCCIS